MRKLRSKLQSGQALLLVLLSMAAVMTVVMSVASRSVTDIAVSTSEEDALRAFSAAEAGIEKALYNGAVFLTPTPVASGTTTGDATFTSKITNSSEGDAFKYPGILDAGESATFWLVGRTSDGGFTCSNDECYRGGRIDNICWGSYGNSTYPAGEKPAILLSIFYDWTGSDTGSMISSGGLDFSNIKVIRQGYDPDGPRASSKGFYTANTGANCKIGDTTFAYSTGNINFMPIQSNVPSEIKMPNGCRGECLIMIKVRVFYNNPSRPEQLGIDMGGGSPLPPQGNRIESTGVAGESTRKVNVFQTYSEPPSIFDAAVFSLTDFSKN